MDLISATRIAAVAGLGFCVLGIYLRIKEIMNRPHKKDLSRARGSSGKAVIYAFTLGMAPWEKESTRIHWIAYIRGILFHIGVFTALAVLLASPWLKALPEVLIGAASLITGIGAIAGFAGIWLRLAEPNLRALSLPDDYFSVFLTGLFTASAFAVLRSPGWVPAFYLISAILFLYIPLSKIRHCVYFFYSKFFFGINFGHRGVIGQESEKYAE
jgi:nitrate reductase gamma subunit